MSQKFNTTKLNPPLLTRQSTDTAFSLEVIALLKKILCITYIVNQNAGSLTWFWKKIWQLILLPKARNTFMHIPTK
jgi:hypothetical protein